MSRARHIAYAILLAATGLVVAVSLGMRAIEQAVTLPARRLR